MLERVKGLRVMKIEFLLKNFINIDFAKRNDGQSEWGQMRGL